MEEALPSDSRFFSKSDLALVTLEEKISAYLNLYNLEVITGIDLASELQVRFRISSPCCSFREFF